MNALEQFSLKNRVAVVLGGTSGIGLAIARGFVQAGAITIASSRDRAKVDATAADLEALGARTLRVTSDVQDRAVIVTRWATTEDLAAGNEWFDLGAERFVAREPEAWEFTAVDLA